MESYIIKILDGISRIIHLAMKETGFLFFCALHESGIGKIKKNS